MLSVEVEMSAVASSLRLKVFRANFVTGWYKSAELAARYYRPALYGVEPEIVQDVQQAFDALVLGLPALDMPCIITFFFFHREVC